MKNLLTIVSTFVLSASIASAAPFYVAQKGLTGKFVNTDADGKVIGYYTQSANSVSNGGMELSTTLEFMDENGKSVLSEPFTMTFKYVDESRTDASISSLKGAMKSSPYMPKGNVIAFPSEIKVGDTFPDHKVNIKIGVIKTNNRITERKVTGKETITVPAGTFECYVVEEKEYYQGGPKPFSLKTWITKEEGVIRQDCWNSDGKFYKKMELISIK